MELSCCYKLIWSWWRTWCSEFYIKIFWYRCMFRRTNWPSTTARCKWWQLWYCCCITSKEYSNKSSCLVYYKWRLKAYNVGLKTSKIRGLLPDHMRIWMHKLHGGSWRSWRCCFRNHQPWHPLQERTGIWSLLFIAYTKNKQRFPVYQVLGKDI